MSDERQSRDLPDRSLSDEPQDQISPEDALAEAKAQLEQANRRATEAEDRERQAHQARQVAETRVTDATGAALTAQERQLESALTAANTRADQAEATLREAYAANDPTAIARAQRQLAEAAADTRSLTQQQQWFTAEKARQAEEAKRAPQQQTPPNTVQVNTPAGRLNVSASARDWMDKHPRFYEDKGYYNAAINAHQQAVEDGTREGTPAYYRALDEAMKDYEGYEAYRRGDQQPVTDNLSQRQQQRRSPSSVGAPVSRQTAQRQNPDAPPSWQEVARHIGGEVNQNDLREFARVNGYMKNANDEAGFARYLKEQGDIINMGKRGEHTGLVYEQTYR